ncbi:beta-ketoacyl synthase N-terminal-like domain-containing protein [Streptomyces gobiensis]|uniref:beta-ketoacyl synthase N-terminal-like domain-containing protein n=1 Tax=Streptomyces gobiensis TaxID=2875706 RepID=UPI001E5DE793|nr:beta-ketoacyl synthase N-terminal-like domain-containing protein [Streptomyces gobiensis]UGY94197.1 3-oxoacyl-ACP synthase [Streptomyces gobiensis]
MSGFVISTWSAVSPFGIGRASFERGLTQQASTAAEPGGEDEWGPLPAGTYLPVPGFSAREVLGKKGTRSMDRVSALAVTTIRELLEENAHSSAVATGERAALVLGTTTGSVKSMMDITRDTLIHEKPFYIDAARIPNAIMNSAAAQCAIWHQIKGPNTTVAGGRVAPLLALRYSLRLLAAERAKAALCGGAEELSAPRAWLEHHGRSAAEPAAPLGEGCALLLVEPAAEAQGSALADVLAVETGIHTGADLRHSLIECLRRAVARTGVTLDDVWAVSSVPGEGPLGDAERAAVDDVFGSPKIQRIQGARLWGDAGAATAAFQTVSVLSSAQASAEAAGRVAVVVSVDRDGVLGCALLRMRARS